MLSVGTSVGNLLNNSFFELFPKMYTQQFLKFFILGIKMQNL